MLLLEGQTTNEPEKSNSAHLPYEKAEATEANVPVQSSVNFGADPA